MYRALPVKKPPGKAGQLHRSSPKPTGAATAVLATPPPAHLLGYNAERGAAAALRCVLLPQQAPQAALGQLVVRPAQRAGRPSHGQTRSVFAVCRFSCNGVGAPGCPAPARVRTGRGTDLDTCASEAMSRAHASALLSLSCPIRWSVTISSTSGGRPGSDACGTAAAAGPAAAAPGWFLLRRGGMVRIDGVTV